jgi:shikimate kinase
MAPKLVLTGFMATGKSSVARALAARLGWRLIDSDTELIARAGKPIAAIFAEDGEPQFRALEREVIAAIVADPAQCAQCGMPRPAVVATGGGALADEANYAALSRAGVIVCLSARPEVIAARVRRSRTPRPKLSEGAGTIEERIARLLQERRSAYARADITIDTSDAPIAQIAERVIDAFAEAGRRRWPSCPAMPPVRSTREGAGAAR